MKPLSISFSGGRSSAVMTKLCMDWWRGKREIVVTFANTGAEDPRTLEFVDRCDREWSLDVVWIEADVQSEHGVGTRHRIVDFETASRNGEPFKEYVRKYGLPGPGRPHCTSRLKIDPMESFIRRELGWQQGEYETAVGIRADEMYRINDRHREIGLIYPLIIARIGVDEVRAIMRQSGIDLDLPGDHFGNCVTCWKKSWRKLFTVYREDPSSFDLFAELEEIGKEARSFRTGENNNRMWRGHMSTAQVIRMAETAEFEPYSDSAQATLFDAGLDVIDYDCGESCEVYGIDTETTP